MSKEVQDNVREEELRTLFGLTKDESTGRGGVDAYLHLNNTKYEFELKSTTTSNVTTVRDFSLSHIEKWKNKHWIIGYYSNLQILEYVVYAPPSFMKQWIDEKYNYIELDFKFAELIPESVTMDHLASLLPQKNKYTLQDAKFVQKKQYTIEKYKLMMDLHNGYSKERMLQIVQDRIRYLMHRGSTLNNPHIPNSYFKTFPSEYFIKDNYEEKLKKLINNHSLETKPVNFKLINMQPELF